MFFFIVVIFNSSLLCLLLFVCWFWLFMTRCDEFLGADFCFLRLTWACTAFRGIYLVIAFLESSCLWSVVCLVKIRFCYLYIVFFDFVDFLLSKLGSDDFNCSFESVFLVLESIDSVLCCYSSSLLFCLWWSYSFRYIVMFVSVLFYCCNF